MENSSLKGGKSNAMKVYRIEGKRKKDLSTFYGLKFEDENHASFFLTPGQFHTVIALRHEALEIVRKLPRLPKHIKGEVKWE